MSKELTIQDFYESFMNEVSMAKDTETFGWEDQDFLTAVMLDYLSDAGEVEDPVVCPFRAYGLQMNAYQLSADGEEVTIFVSLYAENDSLISVSKTDVDAAIKRGIQLYRKATNDLFTSFEKDSDTYEFAKTVHDHKSSIKTAKIVALTNGLVKAMDLKEIELEGVKISFSVWDIERIFKCINSGKQRESIEINFQDQFGTTIPCLKNSACDKYSTYLAIINGQLLADVYEVYGPRLLERNVRSFLQVKGAVNKGIRDTLRDEPEMFLAYNNGISVTAESVETVKDASGSLSIKSIKDMQIVNGGQTTASIFNARKDKKINADLTNVYVQMKLTVISSAENMDEMVPKISAYANTQNKIQMADFSANDPFHRKIEELSRTTWAPSQGGAKPQNWFYERARGQYADMLSKESTTLKRKTFKETHPLFTKTDLAKYENTWDQLPYYVSEGAQKNFKRFTLRLSDRGNFVPDNKYYERLIAKAIIFRNAEKLVQKQQYGGYRANIVTYTIAYLSFITAQRIDLDAIWKNQALSENLETSIVEVSRLVHESIVNPPGGQNVGEWCKKPKCWEEIKSLEYDLPDGLKKELVDTSKPDYVVSAASGKVSSLNAVTAEEQEIINAASDIDASTWYALSRWAKQTGNFQGWQRSIVFSVGNMIARGKAPSYKQSVQAMKVYNEALEKGFKIDDNGEQLKML